MHFRAQKCRTKRRQGRTFGRPRNFDCYFPFSGTPLNIRKPSFSRCALTVELIYGRIFRFSRVYMHFRTQKCRTIRRQGRKFGRPRNFDCYFGYFPFSGAPLNLQKTEIAIKVSRRSEKVCLRAACMYTFQYFDYSDAELYTHCTQ